MALPTGPYAAVPGGSNGHFRLDSSDELDPRDGNNSEGIDETERGRRSAERAGRAEQQADEDDERDEDEVGLLGREVREMEELEEEGAKAGGRRSWYQKFDPRILGFIGLGLLAGVAVGYLMPSESLHKHGGTHMGEISHKEQEDYYSGQDIDPGTFSDDPVFADNPIPHGDMYDDIPFASVAAPLGTPNPHAVAQAATDDEDELAATPVETHLDNGRRWNGTHWFDKTVLIVSLDGVRADYLERGLTPHLLSISKKGLRATHMVPRFPSLTFPNHWSLMTGLNVESHHIVANDFIDPALGNAEFHYTDPKKSWDPKWWGGEPMWSTAVKNGLRAMNCMWPGPPKMKDGTKPTVWFPFQNRYHYTKKVDLIFNWLDLPLSKRPHLVNAYAPEVDQQGHRTGPHSHEVEKELSQMDDFAKRIWDGLALRNLTDIIDVIFVSDHGMTDTHNERLVFLDDILGKDGFAGIQSQEGWPSAGLRFQSHVDQDEMLRKLLEASAGSKGGFSVYTHETMPERYHFSNHERIAPIYVVPHVGWAVTNHHEFDVEMKGKFHPIGNHGYDNEHEDMHAIFVAHGPFANQLKQSPVLRRAGEQMSNQTGVTVIPGFDNTEVYNLVVRLLGIPEDKWAPTNGTDGFWEKYF